MTRIKNKKKCRIISDGPRFARKIVIWILLIITSVMERLKPKID